MDEVNDSLEIFGARLDAIEKAVDGIYAVRTKHDVPLEVLLNEEPFRSVHKDTFDEGRIDAAECLVPNFAEEKLTYSQSLESGKQYYLDRGLIGVVALKILEGEGVFKFEGIVWKSRICPAGLTKLTLVEVAPTSIPI